MTTSSSVVDVSSFTTDAKFRAWGSAVSAAIVASGLTVTSDTGQVNWTTVLRPTGASTKAGYEVYRFNDTLQSTAPIFLRIDYGTAQNVSGNNPMTWLTVGTGSDGAGNITGVMFAVTGGQSTGTSAASNTTMAVRAAYSTSAGVAFIDSGVQSNLATNVDAGTWVIQRTCDSSGNPTGAGCAVIRFGGSGSSTDMTPVSFGPYAVFAARRPAVGVLNVGATSVSGGGVIELYRNWITCPTPVGSLGSIGYLTADITSGAVFSAAPFGSTAHNYLALGAVASGGFEQASSANISAAVIWE